MLFKTNILAAFVAASAALIAAPTPVQAAYGWVDPPANWGKGMIINDDYAYTQADADNIWPGAPSQKNDTGTCMEWSVQTGNKIIGWRNHNAAADTDTIYIRGAGAKVAIVSGAGLSNPQLATDGNLQWVVAWLKQTGASGGTELWYAYSVDNAASFTTVGPVVTNTPDKQLVFSHNEIRDPNLRVALSANSATFFYLTYNGIDGGFTQRYLNWTTNVGWTRGEVFSGRGVKPGGVANDRAGHWYAVWKVQTADPNSPYSMYYSYSATDGRTFSYGQPIIASYDSELYDGVSEGPHISMNASKWAVTWSGRRGVVYAQGQTGNPSQLTSYEVPVPPMYLPANWYVRPDVTVNAPTDVVVYNLGQQPAWGYGTEDYVKVVYRNRDRTWTVPKDLGRAGACGGTMSDSGGHPRLCAVPGGTVTYVVQDTWKDCDAEQRDISTDGDVLAFWWAY